MCILLTHEYLYDPNSDQTKAHFAPIFNDSYIEIVMNINQIRGCVLRKYFQNNFLKGKIFLQIVSYNTLLIAFLLNTFLGFARGGSQNLKLSFTKLFFTILSKISLFYIPGFQTEILNHYQNHQIFQLHVNCGSHYTVEQGQ